MTIVPNPLRENRHSYMIPVLIGRYNIPQLQLFQSVEDMFSGQYASLYDIRHIRCPYGFQCQHTCLLIGIAAIPEIPEIDSPALKNVWYRHRHIFNGSLLALMIVQHLDDLLAQGLNEERVTPGHAHYCLNGFFWKDVRDGAGDQS